MIKLIVGCAAIGAMATMIYVAGLIIWKCLPRNQSEKRIAGLANLLKSKDTVINRRLQ